MDQPTHEERHKDIAVKFVAKATGAAIATTVVAALGPVGTAIALGAIAVGLSGNSGSVDGDKK